MARYFYGHVFPVAGPHWTRGAIGEFGAPRSGGRTHEGFDIVAACGTPLVAVRGGGCCAAGYDPVLYGNYLLIHGEGERPQLLLRPHAPAGRWSTAATGSAPASGSARWARPATRARSAATSTSRSTSHGVRSTPEPALRRWDRYS